MNGLGAVGGGEALETRGPGPGEWPRGKCRSECARKATPPTLGRPTWDLGAVVEGGAPGAPVPLPFPLALPSGCSGGLVFMQADRLPLTRASHLQRQDFALAVPSLLGLCPPLGGL